MEMPLLTVVIPVYNAKSTLRACVDSILEQSQDAVELILVDDGSAEETATLCDVLASENSNCLHVIHQKNAGSLAARLTGSAIAKGDYLMYVDADDVLLEGAIAHILADISGGADLYLYDYMMDTVGGETSNHIKLMEYSQPTMFAGKDKIQVSHVFMKGMMNTVCATAIRRAFFEGITFRFPEQKICHGEDRLQKMQMLIAAEKIVYVPYAFYHYKWYPSTQGGDLRTGRFSAKIYDNFRMTWPIEREYYSALGFGEEDCIRYDREKLAKICGLLEHMWGDKHSKASDVNALIEMLQSDELFLSLSSPEILSRERAHIRRVGKMIRAGQSRRLKFYWCICRFVRYLKYRTK